MTAALLTGVLFAVAGALHCAGMCGGLIGCVACSNGRVAWERAVLYNTGRTLSYIMLGCAAGLLGVTLQRVSLFTEVQIVLTTTAGFLVILFGLHLGGWIADPLSRFALPINKVLVWLRNNSGPNRNITALALGIANGLLPCGLVYAALSVALIQSTLPQSVAVMAGFGAGTFPAMMITPWLLARGTRRNVTAPLRIAAVVVVIFGVFTLFRSAWIEHEGMHAALLHNATANPHHVANVD